MPKDTNAHGTIFGGVILSYIDIAAAIEARKHTTKQIVLETTARFVLSGGTGNDFSAYP